jgi:hypothetical protein
MSQLDLKHDMLLLSSLSEMMERGRRCVVLCCVVGCTVVLSSRNENEWRRVAQSLIESLSE